MEKEEPEETQKQESQNKPPQEEEIKTDFTWFKNARIYQVFIDRFAGYKTNYSEEELKTQFLYGNLKALLGKLDYIASMDFNVIWLSPFFANQPKGYHGYHPINFNHVDPRFAFGEHAEDNITGNPFEPEDIDILTSSDNMLKEFIEECHKRNFKVMMDLVPNHVHETHPFFIDAKNNKDSKYRKWFYFIEDMTEDEKKNLFPEDLLKEKQEDNNIVDPNQIPIAENQGNDIPIVGEDQPQVQNQIQGENVPPSCPPQEPKDPNQQPQDPNQQNQQDPNQQNQQDPNQQNQQEPNQEPQEGQEKEKEEPPERKYCYPYLTFYRIGELPKLNLDTPECGDYMIKVVRKYLKLGIDAVRVDHAPGPSLQFLKRMTREIHKDYPTVPFIGEVPPASMFYVAETIKAIPIENLLKVKDNSLDIVPYIDEIFLMYEGVLDGLLDFTFKYIIECHVWGYIQSEEDTIKNINEHYARFKNSKLILAKFLDSHDENRFLFTCNQDKNLMKRMIDILYTHFEGRDDPLIIYYGTEDFMTQWSKKDEVEYGDAYSRSPMNFEFEWVKLHYDKKK